MARQMQIKAGEILRVETRYGHLSRGKVWGKKFATADAREFGGSFAWVDKSKSGVLAIREPGFYTIGSSDGFNRKESFDLDVTAA